MNLKISLSKRRVKSENYWLKEWINSTFFLAIAFANYFLPFFICLMAGINKEPQEPEYVIGIGLSTGFMVNIFQIGAILCMTLSFGTILYTRKRKFRPLTNAEIFTFQIMTVIIIGIILIPLYIGFSYLYMYFSGAFSNTRQAVCDYGLNFLVSSSPSMLLVALNTFLIYKVFFDRQKNWKSILLIFINLVINCLCVGLIGYFVGQNTYSYGYGLVVGNVICVLFNLAVLYKYKLLWKLKFTLKLKSFLFILRKVWGFALSNLFITFLRSFLLLAVGASLKVNSQLTPWNYLLGKIIWYNALYMLLFINSGLGQQLSYIAVRNYQDTPKTYNDAAKLYWFLPLLSLVITGGFAVGFNYLIVPIAHLYASNSIPGTLPGPNGFNLVYATGVGSINYFIGFPYSKTYLYTAIFVVLVTLSTAFKALTPIKILKTKKEDRKDKITVIVSACLVLGFIVGVGIGVRDLPSFPYMEGFGMAMVCMGAMFAVLNGLGFLKAKKNNAKLWDNDINANCIECKKVTIRWDISK